MGANMASLGLGNISAQGAGWLGTMFPFLLFLILILLLVGIN
jgi:hypothetical protein